MIIDKTIKAAAMFSAESNIRPTLKGVQYKDGEFQATDSFSACVFNAKPDGDFGDHGSYPNIGIEEIKESDEFILDGTAIKKLKFYKDKDHHILNDTMIMGSMHDEKKVFFGRTDLYNDSIVGISKILQNSKFPDIKSYIKEAEEKCEAEATINVEYLLRVAKAMKEMGKTQVHIGIGRVEETNASYPVTKSNTTATTPVLFGDDEGNKMIVMPLARMNPVFYKKPEKGTTSKK